MTKLVWLVIVLVCGQVLARPDRITKANDDDDLSDRLMHPRSKNVKATRINPDETHASYWNRNAQETVAQLIQRVPNTNTAKNVILFLGDGMSIPTIAASRVYIGGEEKQLAFDKFPYTGLSKTYCVDHQVTDSAASATAYLGGVKANMGTIGVTAAVTLDDCAAMLNGSNHVHSIGKWFQDDGRWAGLVTTARVTHASPAGVYAHTADRDWECDTDVLDSNEDPTICHDIAHQIVHNEIGRNLHVILGGGRAQFLPDTEEDPIGHKGSRSDGINMINTWLELKEKDNKDAEYVWNRDQLLSVKDNTEYVLGLFDIDHMTFNVKRNKSLEPSLEEMTEAAIKLLSKQEAGYFLFVEGARIDMGHHDARARKALDETAEFSKAIQRAVDLTNEEDTLIVVTSDHAHTMSYAGYAARGNDVFGIAGDADDKLPYSTISYANGPGYTESKNGDRHDISDDDMTDYNYRFPAVAPLDSETHGGDDVAIFARGPWAHLFAGVMEENVIPHVMAYASCVGTGLTACNQK